MPDIMEAIEGRRSIRKYKDQQISREALDAILRAGMLAPSASNKQPWHFIAIQDQALIAELNDAILRAMGKNSNAYVSAMAARERYAPLFHAPTVILVCGVENSSWSHCDCALAAQNMALAAYGMGIGSCMVGFALNLYGDQAGDQSALLAKLWIPQGYRMHYAFCFGYPDETPPARPRDYDKVTYIG